MSLTPCRFFAQGNCRYGNTCRFYHGQPTGGTATGGFFGNRMLAPSSFQPQQQQQQTALNLTQKSNQNLDIIVETVKKDMQEWQASHIWPYSCYGPVGGKPNVPGFEDLSPEEYRYSYFVNGGNVPPQITQQFQQMSLLRQNYQTYTQENRNVIERIATANVPTTPTSVQGGGGGFGIGQSSGGSIFGGNFSSGSVFGGGGSSVGGVAATGVFGQSSGVFQGTQQSVFGGGQGQAQQAQQQQPLFSGGTGSGGLFQAPQSVFGGGQAQVQQQPQQQATPSFFPQQQQQPVAPPTMFQQQPPQQGLVAPQPQQSIFGGSGSIFGGGGGVAQVPQQQTQQQSQLFGTTPSIFGGPTGNSPMASGFTGGAPSASAQPSVESIQATSSQQKYVYSEESELTAEEMEAFKATDFSVDNLPSKPPPCSLCL